MSDDLRTEDDIARLFAEANPIENPARTMPPSAPPTPRTRSDVMVDLETPSSEHEPQQHVRPIWWALGAAAALIALLIGLAAVVFDDDTSPADESGTPSVITAPDTIEALLPQPVRSGPVFDLIDAFNDRDADGMTAAFSDAAPTATTDQVDDIVTGFPWYDAFGWRWTDASCEAPTADTVRCDVTVRNRLTDYTGVTRSAQLLATLDDDAIESLSITEDFADYSPVAFEPFQEYVAATAPDDFDLMWADQEPEDIDLVATLFDEHLTAYTAGAEPPTPLHRAFLDAHGGTSPERADLVGMFAPGATIRFAWAHEPGPYSDGMAVIGALGFDWGTPDYCRVPQPSQTVRITCLTRPITELDAAGLELSGQTVSFEMTADGIATFDAGSIARSLDERLAPFYGWIAREHPADADALLTEQEGRTTLVLDPSGTDRLGELVDDYVSTVADDASG